MKKSIFWFVGTVAEWRKIQDIRKKAEEKRRLEKIGAWLTKCDCVLLPGIHLMQKSCKK